MSALVSPQSGDKPLPRAASLRLVTEDPGQVDLAIHVRAQTPDMTRVLTMSAAAGSIDILQELAGTFLHETATSEREAEHCRLEERRLDMHHERWKAAMGVCLTTLVLLVNVWLAMQVLVAGQSWTAIALALLVPMGATIPLAVLAGRDRLTSLIRAASRLLPTLRSGSAKE